MKVHRGNPDGLKRLEQVFFFGGGTGMKSELMTSLAFFHASLGKTSKVSGADPESVYC